MSKSDNEVVDESVDFGSQLATARNAQHYTVEDINQHLKIPINIINAIESNAIDVLPPATFTQGYIKTYARFLEISELKVLAAYHRAVPQEALTHLKYRSSLPHEANSQSPLIKAITRLLIVAGVAALIYGGFQYYQEKVDDMGLERETKEQSFTGNSLDSPGNRTLDIKQNARLTGDDELLVEGSVPFEYSGTPGVVGDTTITGATSIVGDEVVAEEPPADETPPPILKDVVEIIAEKGSWMQVNDDANTRLFYNLLAVGKSVKLEGVAPFRISLGNASTTKVLVNGISVDMRGITRPNNTAVFTVSTKDQKVIFH